MNTNVTGEQRPTVLIVEDSDLQNRMYQAIFRQLDIRSVRAGTKREALALARQTMPALIIMDINLPDGTGIEATREIRAIEGLDKVPIIAVTTRLSTNQESTLREAGFTEFRSKPIDVADFGDLVKRQLAGVAT
ncbi:response regulator [Roseiterribacter gracilis]|uniref:Response regulator n=1 Tax=Roseiterribacter gracilis TaxID=2812848 RepID=A0A8S8XLA3_9PROT|nr:response regulator [Rhodospirillales bacterium TMPK1]